MLPSNKLLTTLWLAVFLCSCGGKDKRDPGKIYFEQASEYNSYITTQFDEVNRLWNASLAVMDDSVLIYKQLDSLQKASEQSMVNMHSLADFKGDTSYKHAAAEYFKYMLVTSKGSYKEAIEIGLQEDIPDSLYFRFISISNQIGADKDTCINRLKAAQLRFMQLTSKKD
jgi:hypothetical protein